MNDKMAVPGCRGTTAELLFRADGVQALRVEVAIGGEIPLHSHGCVATMFVTAGSAMAIGPNERPVRVGDVIVKAIDEPHGFADVVEPFSFISISNDGGIMHDGEWDMRYSADL
jgi:quercetin dioxygenase-like cupin family protein